MMNDTKIPNVSWSRITAPDPHQTISPMDIADSISTTGKKME
jgi:hypothetical protein